eukprot:SAG31_NODE_14462_length_804_cov_27.876596_1_plen_61_part_01
MHWALLGWASANIASHMMFVTLLSAPLCWALLVFVSQRLHSLQTVLVHHSPGSSSSFSQRL